MIAAGDSAVYTTTVMIDPNIKGNLTVDAQLGATSMLINTGDDTASMTMNVNAVADFVLNKLVSSLTVPPTNTVSVSNNSVVTFTLTVSNVGPSTAAAGAEVSDMVPAGLTFDGFGLSFVL